MPLECDITMTSLWVRWCLKSSASRLFTQLFIQGADHRKYQGSTSLAFVRGVTGDRTKGQWRGKYFYLMTSSYILTEILQLYYNDDSLTNISEFGVTSNIRTGYKPHIRTNSYHIKTGTFTSTMVDTLFSIMHGVDMFARKYVAMQLCTYGNDYTYLLSIL